MRAKAVLGLGPDAHEVSQVQQAFRSLMRKLHPDRIGVNREATEAMELLREAKASCERAFSRLRAPQAPTRLAATVLCAAVGQRRIRLDWRAPEESRSCPVRRYLVAALDPAYGQALTITVLEPEYNESLKRFTSLDELATYVLAEEELSKLPSFFQQATAVVQVAAENEAGQSAWCTLQLSLRSSASAPRSLKVDEKTTAPRSSKDEKPGKRANPSVPSASSRECREFEATAHSLAREGGNQLCTWLRKQGKALLGTWLRSQGWPTTGSKDELVDRVAFAVGAVGKEAVEEKPSLEQDRDDIVRLKQIMRPDPDWIAFSSTEARWINFNAQMREVFGRSRSCRCDEDAVNAWIDDAMSVLFHWISKQIIMTESRAALFRSLGRGWIWIQLSSSGVGREDKSKLPEEQRTRFKWWFENLSRVTRNRQHDIDKLKLKGDMLKKYTTGYMPMSELVFLIYGIAPAMPIIGIQKWSPHYKEVDRWATDDNVKKAVEKPLASEAERQAHAAHVEQQKSRKQRERERERENEKERESERHANNFPAGLCWQRAGSEFESLLASLKREAGMSSACEEIESGLTGVSMMDELVDSGPLVDRLH
ncbi:unnamed protein product [Effrenium voratum]|uniref:J domain-containing protein n=1 Tax=Effrenium voratum TaxID=2562239 RepID=A0AA36IRC1_9DINO|nr:unnamed protein product [Effrenium voratum]